MLFWTNGIAEKDIELLSLDLDSLLMAFEGEISQKNYCFHENWSLSRELLNSRIGKTSAVLK
jgi:hypothetical protein